MAVPMIFNYNKYRVFVWLARVCVHRVQSIALRSLFLRPLRAVLQENKYAKLTLFPLREAVLKISSC